MVILSLLFFVVPPIVVGMIPTMTYFTFLFFWPVLIYLLLLALFINSSGFKVVASKQPLELAYLLIGGLLWYPVVISVDMLSSGFISRVGYISSYDSTLVFVTGKLILICAILYLSKLTGKKVYEKYFAVENIGMFRKVTLVFFFLGTIIAGTAMVYSRIMLHGLFS